jgi:hypothetical protein
MYYYGCMPSGTEAVCSSDMLLESKKSTQRCYPDDQRLFRRPSPYRGNRNVVLISYVEGNSED